MLSSIYVRAMRYVFEVIEMRKRIFLAGLLVFLMLAMVMMTGCTKNYDRSDIKQYVKDELGLKGFSVSKEPTEVTNPDDGYTDYLWEVTESDGTVFYVLDDYYYGMEWVTNSLRNNWNAVHVREYLQQADTSGFEIEEPGEDDLMASVALTGTYRTRKELLETVRRLNDLADGSDLDLSIPFYIKFDIPYRSIGDYEKEEGDLKGSVRKSEHITSDYTEDCMLHLLLDMRDEDRLREFSEQEIHTYVNGNQHAIGIRGEDGQWVMTDDLVCSLYSYGISFPTIYEVLNRSGYPVYGTKDDFTFTALDGSVYEMSESFVENDSYYYIKDGVHVPMEYYFYDHFYIGKLMELTGIDASERWMIEKEEQEAASEESEEQ